MAWLKAGHRVPNLRFRRQSKYRECGLLAALFDLIASRLFGMERQLGVNVGCPLRPGLLTYRSIVGKMAMGHSRRSCDLRGMSSLPPIAALILQGHEPLKRAQPRLAAEGPRRLNWARASQGQIHDE